MPLLGTREVASLTDDSLVMPDYNTETWKLPGASILQVIYEIRQEAMLSLLPPALHPTIPPTVFFNVTEVPESPVGPFTLAEARVGCRAGARPRGLVTRCFTSTLEAAEALGKRWGYPATAADVRLKKNYERVTATVSLNGETILDVAMMDPAPIGAGDVQYLPNVNLTRVMKDGAPVQRIVQVDPDFVMQKADRGRPQLSIFDVGAWRLPGADAWWPVSASLVQCEIDMPKIRYVFDPAVPALQGLEKVAS